MVGDLVAPVELLADVVGDVAPESEDKPEGGEEGPHGEGVVGGEEAREWLGPGEDAVVVVVEDGDDE